METPEKKKGTRRVRVFAIISVASLTVVVILLFAHGGRGLQTIYRAAKEQYAASGERVREVTEQERMVEADAAFAKDSQEGVRVYLAEMKRLAHQGEGARGPLPRFWSELMQYWDKINASGKIGLPYIIEALEDDNTVLQGFCGQTLETLYKPEIDAGKVKQPTGIRNTKDVLPLVRYIAEHEDSKEAREAAQRVLRKYDS
jgi:hypothetical protein